MNDAQSSDKPSFIAFKTKIGKGTKHKEGSEKSHGSPLGPDETQYLKSNINFTGEEFFIPQDIKQLWEQAWLRNQEGYNSWQERFSTLLPKQKIYLDQAIITLSKDIKPPNKPEATRVSSGKIIESMMQNENKIIVGSADLSGSNGLTNPACKAINSTDFSGNFIHYGVRENAMAAIMNGLALSNFSPIGGTFFVFSDYMRPSIRLAALMGLPVIFVMTHDSIGVGEDGPTHQPIEQLASFRAMPNIDVFRPADFIEVKECYEIALKNTNKPSMMVLSRQNVPQIRYKSEHNESEKGGYIISEALNPKSIDFTIFSTGSEVSIATEVKQLLEQDGASIRICSVPCFSILLKQGKDYLDKLKGSARNLVAIEAASSFGWTTIIGLEGIFFGLDTFGASAPAEQLYEHYGLTATTIAKILKKSHD